MAVEEGHFFRILIEKELVQMKIRNNDELKLFEETLDRCHASVLLVTPDGDQYDLKEPAGRFLGIAEMLRENEWEEPEVFTTASEDEMQFFRMLHDFEKKSA